ncbi:MAG: hypothetical protein GC165_17295 [Armatimonadetes bacterium]|nr:hypothetical protein [Armatimonadota bacterium]
MKRHSTAKLFGVTAFLLGAVAANAQSDIVMTVKDSAGRAITGAAIVLIGPEKSPFFVNAAVTNRDGNAVVAKVRGGKYIVVATKDDFAYQMKEVTLSSNRPTQIDFRLGPNKSEKILVFARTDDTNEPIRGAQAEITLGNATVAKRYLSGSNGLAIIPIDNAPNARTSVSVSANGFETYTAGVITNFRRDTVAVFNLKRTTLERMVMVRTMDSSGRNPISRARVTFEADDRSESKTVTTDSSGNASVRLTKKAVYTVTVDGGGQSRVTEKLDLRNSSSSVIDKTYRLRGTTGNPSGTNFDMKLSGDIRMKGGKIKMDETVSADIGVYYTGGRNETMPASVSVRVLGPSGRVVASDSYRLNLEINGTTRKSLDIRTNEAGVYTIEVTATGNGMKDWSATKKFTVDRERADLNAKIDGTYAGTIDVVNLAGDKVAHTASIKLSNSRSNLMDVSGYLAPGRNEGFHITFKGTYDRARQSLSAVGELVDKSNRRWDIRLTGKVDSAGRLDLSLSIREIGGNYNRRADGLLKKS